MQVVFDYSETCWAVMPRPDAGVDEPWVAEQVERVGVDDPSPRSAAEAAARAALARRRAGIDTSLYFRPPGLPCTGVVHIETVEADLDDGAFGRERFIPSDVARDAVFEFSTEHSPHGVSVAYVSQHVLDDGTELAGLVYGLRFDGAICTVFSELGDRQSAGAMQSELERVVASLRVER